MKEEELMLRRMKSKMSRYQFEQKFSGEWTQKDGGRKRTNGRVTTFVKSGHKFFHDGTVMLKARTWYEIWNEIEKSIARQRGASSTVESTEVLDS